MSIRQIYNTNFVFLNNMHIIFDTCGDAKLNDNFIPHNTLFIPDFGFNLLYVGALLKDNKYMISFYQKSFCHTRIEKPDFDWQG